MLTVNVKAFVAICYSIKQNIIIKNNYCSQGASCYSIHSSSSQVSLRLRRMQMEKVIEINQDSRTEWSTPELKKVDIEQITAFQTGSGADGLGGSTS